MAVATNPKGGKRERGQGAPWHRVDISGERIRDLTALRPVKYIPRLGWVWAMRCERIVKGRRCGRIRHVPAYQRRNFVACARCSGKGVDMPRYENIRQPGKRGRPRNRVTARNYQRLIASFTEAERELFDGYMGNRVREGERGVKNLIACCDLVLDERRKAGN